MLNYSEKTASKYEADDSINSKVFSEMKDIGLTGMYCILKEFCEKERPKCGAMTNKEYETIMLKHWSDVSQNVKNAVIKAGKLLESLDSFSISQCILNVDREIENMFFVITMDSFINHQEEKQDKYFINGQVCTKYEPEPNSPLRKLREVMKDENFRKNLERAGLIKMQEHFEDMMKPSLPDPSIFIKRKR